MKLLKDWVIPILIIIDLTSFLYFMIAHNYGMALVCYALYNELLRDKENK